MKNNIKQYRTMNNMTQAELGKKLNVSAGAISSWEIDRTEPTMQQSIEMCKLFDCTLEELFSQDMFASVGKSAPQEIEKVGETTIETNEAIIVAELFQKADNSTKDVVKRILDYGNAYDKLLKKKGE